ncbi:hypothetical protein KJZ99_06065 [bacterium]|nr:hypothetical protein [bacterium]
MKFIPFYKNALNCKNEDQVFEYFLSHLKPSIMLWSYFVDWEKVKTNSQDLEIALNSLNYLIGKKDFDNEFRRLLQSNPGLARALPALVVRDGKGSMKFNILVNYKQKRLEYEEVDFSKSRPNDSDIESYLNFVKGTGLRDIIASQRVKNLVDYMFGVEAGLNSNARKNRIGFVMEDIVEVFIADACQRRNFPYLAQANASKIQRAWGIAVPYDKSSRKYDFVINTKSNLFIIETNFYGSEGTKQKATAGEYNTLFKFLSGRHKFIWITDGQGLAASERPLRETFDAIDYLFSLDMLEHGVLDQVLQ